MGCPGVKFTMGPVGGSGIRRLGLFSAFRFFCGPLQFREAPLNIIRRGEKTLAETHIEKDRNPIYAVELHIS